MVSIILLRTPNNLSLRVVPIGCASTFSTLTPVCSHKLLRNQVVLGSNGHRVAVWERRVALFVSLYLPKLSQPVDLPPSWITGVRLLLLHFCKLRRLAYKSQPTFVTWRTAIKVICGQQDVSGPRLQIVEGASLYSLIVFSGRDCIAHLTPGCVNCSPATGSTFWFVPSLVQLTLEVGDLAHVFKGIDVTYMTYTFSSFSSVHCLFRDSLLVEWILKIYTQSVFTLAWHRIRAYRAHVHVRNIILCDNLSVLISFWIVSLTSLGLVKVLCVQILIELHIWRAHPCNYRFHHGGVGTWFVVRLFLCLGKVA